MTIGNELDQAFYNLGQRITRLEKKEVAYPIENDFGGRIDTLEAELNDRIDEVENDMGFDPDDLRCDLESQIEEVRDSASYMDDRIDDLECYKCGEDEVECIVDRKLDDRAYEIRDALEDELMDRATELVNHEINARVEARIAEIEARLNRPTLGARVLRWLREGPSIKEVATGWYASIRRGS